MALVVVLLAVAACGDNGADEVLLVSHPIDIEVTSAAFVDGSDIPVRFTCDGDDVSPPLAWTGIPEGTEGLALIVDDPDARNTWVHWVMYNIAPEVGGLPEGGTTSLVARQGKNDFGNLGYGGPCPPRGSRHRYFFKTYAVDSELDLSAGAEKADLIRAMLGRVLAEGRLMGRYKRR